MVGIEGLLVALALAAGDRFEVVVAPEACATPLTGRLVLVVAKEGSPEPRQLIAPSGPALFGVDLVALEPGAAAVVDDATLGHPLPLAALPAGDYFVQAVFNYPTLAEAYKVAGYNAFNQIQDLRRQGQKKQAA